jgi:hypothetical protein
MGVNPHHFPMRLPRNLPSKQLSPAVESVVSSFLSFVGDRRRYTYEELEEVALRCPIAAASVDARIHLTLTAMGDFTHSEEAIAADVKTQLTQMKGDWNTKLKEMSPIAYGFSLTEKYYKNFKMGAGIGGLQRLNPQRIRFEGSTAGIEQIQYCARDGRDIKIPYSSVIHFRNQSHLLLDSTDPRGVGVLERMRPLYEAYNLMLVAIVLASQRQATPIIYQKTNISSQVPLLNSAGQPIKDSAGKIVVVNAGTQARAALEELENSSVLVGDRLDEFGVLAAQTDGKLLLSAIDFILGQIAMCALVPRTLMMSNVGGTGDSSLIEGQIKMFRQTIEWDLKTLTGGLIEYLFKPMLQWNYGELEDYGDFAVNEEQMINASQMITAISNAVSGGALAGWGENAADRIRELAGITGEKQEVAESPGGLPVVGDGVEEGI